MDALCDNSPILAPSRLQQRDTEVAELQQQNSQLQQQLAEAQQRVVELEQQLQERDGAGGPSAGRIASRSSGKSRRRNSGK